MWSEFRKGSLCGDAFGFAEICLVPQVFNAECFNCPLEDYPNIHQIYATCLALDGAEAAHPKNQPDRFSGGETPLQSFP